MPRLRTVLGYTWAALAAPLVVAAATQAVFLGGALAGRTGVKVSPRFTGGEVALVKDHGAYRTSVHRPVFDGLFGERREGFVQVDWEPVTALPESIREEIDVFGDGASGFYITLNTADGRAGYENKPPGVRGNPKPARLRSGWAIRIKVRNPGK